MLGAREECAGIGTIAIVFEVRLRAPRACQPPEFSTATCAMNEEFHRIIVLMPVTKPPERLTTYKCISCYAGRYCYIVVVEDGSVREPFEASLIAKLGLTGEVIYLVRNLGHQRAIAAGLTYIAAKLYA